jgi:trehalose utilization protein
VVVGEKSNLAIFKTLTTHQDVLIGMVEGDYTATSPHDLGMIVWPVVKEAIAGANKNAILDLARADKVKKVISGIEAVGKLVETETGATLYVEEDFHMKGSIRKTDHSLIISKHVNLCEVIDDVVDLIIEKVLKMGGIVIFLNSGSLITFERIALVLRG